MEEYKVIIWGDDDFNDYDFFSCNCLSVIPKDKNVVIFIPNAPNCVYSLTKRFVAEYNFRYEEDIPMFDVTPEDCNWSQNQFNRLLDDCDLLVAFTDNEQLSTIKLIDEAQRHNIQTLIIPHNFHFSLEDSFKKDRWIDGLATYADDLRVEYSEYYKDKCFPYSSGADTREGRILSNMYECKMVVKGITFNSVEQLYFCLKYSQYPMLQEQFLRLKPKDVKNYARTPEVKERYPLNEVPYGYNKNEIAFCLRVKFKHCKEYRDVLLSHVQGDYQSRPLVEYCSYWSDLEGGCVDWNLDANGKRDEAKDKALRGNWKEGRIRGKNIGGKLMTRIALEGAHGLLDAPVECPYKELRLLGKPVEPVI